MQQKFDYAVEMQNFQENKTDFRVYVDSWIYNVASTRQLSLPVLKKFKKKKQRSKHKTLTVTYMEM